MSIILQYDDYFSFLVYYLGLFLIPDAYQTSGYDYFRTYVVIAYLWIQLFVYVHQNINLNNNTNLVLTL